jgi:uncharacterized protein YktA (UPF0223 family)
MDKVALTAFCCGMLGLSKDVSIQLDMKIRDKDFVGAYRLVKDLRLSESKEDKLMRCVESYRYGC